MTGTETTEKKFPVTAPTQKAGLSVPKIVKWLIKYWFFKSSFLSKSLTLRVAAKR